MRPDYQRLLYIGSLGWPTDKAGVWRLRVYFGHTFISLVHVVYELRLVQDDDQILRDEKHGSLLYRLIHPYTSVLAHPYFTFDNSQVRTVHVARILYFVQ